jgi:hypothetical protein
LENAGKKWRAPDGISGKRLNIPLISGGIWRNTVVSANFRRLKISVEIVFPSNCGHFPTHTNAHRHGLESAIERFWCKVSENAITWQLTPYAWGICFLTWQKKTNQ